LESPLALAAHSAKKNLERTKMESGRLRTDPKLRLTITGLPHTNSELLSEPRSNSPEYYRRRVGQATAQICADSVHLPRPMAMWGLDDAGILKVRAWDRNFFPVRPMFEQIAVIDCWITTCVYGESSP
jgi:hypothetical protein